MGLTKGAMLTSLSFLSSLVLVSPFVLRPAHEYHIYRQIVSPYLGPIYPVYTRRFETSPLVLEVEDVDYNCTGVEQFMNLEDCGSYFICHEKGDEILAAKVNCPGAEENQLAYNPQLNACDDPANVPGCALERSTTGHWRLETAPVVIQFEFEYNCISEGIFLNPEDCGSYVNCNADGEGGIKAAKVTCPPTLVFNDELKVCDWEANVPECASESDSDLEAKDGIVGCNEYDRVARTLLPVENPCFSPVQAFECEDGTFRTDCDPLTDTWFWTIEEIKEGYDCSTKDVGKYEDVEDCKRYIVCSSDGRAYRYHCAQGTYFDPMSKECLHQESDKCSPSN